MSEQRKKKKKTRRDTAEIARENLEQIIGEKLTGEPLDENDTGQATDSAAGPIAGGKARADKLSKERRSEIAKKAARKRWGTKD